jgi:hypothetical protein
MKRLRRVEELLVCTMSIGEAQDIINKEVRILEATDPLWQSWSDFGRRVVASILKYPFEGILPTTNHLKSFNGLLKQKHLWR